MRSETLPQTNSTVSFHYTFGDIAGNELDPKGWGWNGIDGKFVTIMNDKELTRPDI